MAKKINLSFEDAINSLEKCVDKLESGALSFDESLVEFEEAIKLVKLCTEKIESAKQKVRILIETEDGCITDKPFIEEDED